MLFGTGSRMIMVSVENIKPNPYQPRRTFTEDELRSLSDSIKENGILQPLCVRKRTGGNYELIAGERRLRASVLAGLHAVPCVVMNVDDRQSAVLALMENLQRQDLNFFEEAEGIVSLIQDFGLTQEEAAIKLGKKQSTVANKLRLLRLTTKERKLILENNLTERHARALLKLDGQAREQALNQVIVRKLNVAETERFVEKALDSLKSKKKTANSRMIVKDVRIFLNTVSHAIETMRQSGIAAQAEQTITDEYIEYIVRIPKKSDASKQSA